MLNNRRHGRGIYTDNCNCTFDGVFENDKFIKGIYSEGDLYYYDGEFSNNLYEGKGKEKWKDGSSYIGDYKEGLK